MPPFIESTLGWAHVTARHFFFMFWWIWLSAVALTALSESFWVEGRRRQLLEHPDQGWRTVFLAVQLGVLSPPSRTRIFRQARELLARGVSRAGVLAYLVSAQTILIWMLFFIVELDGPQPMIGQLIAVAAALSVLFWAASRMPEESWRAARQQAREGTDPESGSAPIGRSGPVWLRPVKSIGGQIHSLHWPLLYGTLGVGFFLALGMSPGYLSLQGTSGPLIQVGNAGVGLLVAYVTGAPLVGNALFGAGLWRPEFVTYAGLAAFYLGTLVMPFALPRYFTLFGMQLGKRVLRWLVVAILVGALAATAWWWGLHGLAGLLGLQDAFHVLTDSTLRPNAVPWFHHWFAPGF